MPYESVREFLIKSVPYMGLSGLGGLAIYLHQVRKGKKFNLFTLSINILLAMWIGPIIGGFLPETMGDMKYSLIGLSGFLSYPILDLLENKGLDLFIKRFTGKS